MSNLNDLFKVISDSCYKIILFTLLEEDYLTVVWAASNTAVRIDNPADVAFAPETPSVIVDIHQINL